MVATYILDDFDDMFEKRLEWPLQQMLVGQTIMLLDPAFIKRSCYDHTYGRSKGWKFITKMKGGALYVKRTA